MSIVYLKKKDLEGYITPPVSKSDAHRAIICASLAKGITEISPFSMSDDMIATIGAVKALGTKVTLKENCLIIDGNNTFSNIKSKIDCLESGSTLRFMIPIAALTGQEITFVGKGRLPSRPIGLYLEELPKKGVTLKTQGGLPLKISGKLKNGDFHLRGDVSSQFITGLLLALPLLSGDSRIILTTPLQSKPYVDLTISVMKKFSVEVEVTENGYFIKGSQSYKSLEYKTEGDWSQAAFFMCAGAISNSKNGITCKGLNLDSKQGDKKIAEILASFGAEVNLGDQITVKRKTLQGIKIDASQIPDLVPVIASVASLSKGKTTIFGAERLRIKESDRLHTTTVGLMSLGADIKETEDGLIIIGKEKLKGGICDGFNDHRIVMALSIAAQCCEEDVIINGCECINKSYPKFFEDYNMLGGQADVIGSW